MKKRSFLTRLLPMVAVLTFATAARAVEIKAEGGEWMAINSSNTQVSVKFQWTDLTLGRVETATRVIPPKGKVRICPVAGNSQPEAVR